MKRNRSNLGSPAAYHGLRQPAVVEIEDAARLFRKSVVVIREWVKRKHLLTLGKRRKYQWYRFSYAYLLECCDDYDWLDRGQDIESELWRRKNARKQKMAKLENSERTER